jgi:hypothetical protein
LFFQCQKPVANKEKNDGAKKQAKEQDVTLVLPGEPPLVLRDNCGPKHFMDLALNLWNDWIRQKYTVKPAELGIRLLPDAFIGQKEDLNRGANASNTFEFILKDATLVTEDEEIATTICRSPTSLLPRDVRFSYFVDGILKGSIDLDQLPVFKNHMWTYEEERKILHARLKMLGKFPLSAEPSGAATRKKPREKNGDNGGDDEDDDDDVDEDDDGEGDGGPKLKARTGSKNNDDEDLEDDPSSRLLPNEKEFMSLSRSCFSAKTKKKAKALPEMSMDEKKEGLNWALENDLIQLVVFKNLEMSQKYVLDDFDGSGCIIKLKE